MEKNRIYLDANRYLPFRRRKDGRGFARDGSALPFLIEQFIAVAVTDIYMPRYYKSDFLCLPEKLKKRIIFFDTKGSVDRALAVLRPIFEEFEVFPDEQGTFLSYSGDKDIEKQMVSNILTLLSELKVFFCGMDKRLFIDIDTNHLISSIANLRTACRTGGSRTTLAYLNGLFSSYKSQDIDSMVLLPPSSGRMTTVFTEFVEDALYEKISHTAHQLGFPRLSLKVIPKLRRMMKELSTRPPFKQITDLSLKTISIVTALPTPSAGAISEAIASDYLPPVTSFSSEISRGLEYWWLVEPEFFSSIHTKEEYEDWESMKKNHESAEELFFK